MKKRFLFGISRTSWICNELKALVHEDGEMCSLGGDGYFSRGVNYEQMKYWGVSNSSAACWARVAKRVPVRLGASSMKEKWEREKNG